MRKEFQISDSHLYVSWIFIIINEFYALYDFHNISKTYSVSGTVIGWFGFIKDNSDQQWREFEGNLWLLMPFQIFFLIGSYIVKLHSRLENRQRNLKYYNIIVGMTFSFVMHNLGMIFQFSLICGFYLYQKFCQSFKYFVSVLWILAILTLYLNETYQGYSFQMISPSLAYLDTIKKEFTLERWHIMFNLILLRILSFCLDKNWAHKTVQLKNTDTSKNVMVDSIRSYKDLVKNHQPLEEYNFSGYLAYIYYSPLFFAGPTTTFNAFNSQLKIPQISYNRAQVIKYVLRVYLVDFLTFEILLHWCYPSAIARIGANSYIFNTMSVYQLHMMGFINLIFLWYKFLTIWRITRAWALMDGIEVPENMNRCIYNNYNFQGFWRSWHRSFNQWLIRYIYVPLGGSKYKVLNMWIVFTFVAMWHDFKLDLILWAWMICLALVPEILVMSFFNKDYYYKQWWFKYITLFGAGIQIELMCLANLIGFGTGHDGLKVLLDKYISLEGLVTVLFVIIFKDAQGATIGFRIRQKEKQKLQDKNF